MSGEDHDREAIADALSHPARREIVDHLRGTDGEGLRYLANVVTREEANRRGVSITSVGFDRVQEVIVTEHLPVLEDAGLVNYNPETEWLEIDGAPGEYIDSEIAGE